MTLFFDSQYDDNAAPCGHMTRYPVDTATRRAAWGLLCTLLWQADVHGHPQAGASSYNEDLFLRMTTKKSSTFLGGKVYP